MHSNHNVLDALYVRGEPVADYLTSLTPSGEECNNVFSSTAIPEIRAALLGRPKVLLLRGWLEDWNVTGL